MNTNRIAILRILALLFMMPGLAGLVASAVVSTNYLQDLPHFPVVEDQRLTPRNIHGVVVYQTAEENRRLDIMEYSSISIFLVGMVLGIVYLEKWSALRQSEPEDLDELEA